MSDAAPASGDGTEPTVADLADAFVTAVCHAEDVEAARATVLRIDPVDLGGLVAAVDDHQPMTLEVAVDVLAELGVSSAAIATAVGVDHEDVQALLGAPQGGPPPPLADRDARIIEVVAGRGADALPDHRGDPAVVGEAGPGTAAAPDVTIVDDADEIDADRPAGRLVEEPGTTGTDDVDDVSRGATAADDGPADESRGEVERETVGLDEGVRSDLTRVRIESGGDVEESPATVSAPPNRGHVLWAVVFFVLLIGGMVALAALLGAF